MASIAEAPSSSSAWPICAAAACGDDGVGGAAATCLDRAQAKADLRVGNGKVGDDGKRVALEIKVGDRILFGKYSGTEVKIDGEEYLIMRESDILAVIK